VVGVARLWLDLFAPRSFLLPCLSDLVYQRLRVEIVGIYRWRRRKPRWGRILLADAAVKDDDFGIVPKLTSIAQLKDGGKSSRRRRAHASCLHTSHEHLHVRDGLLVHRRAS
jgi:hypothetical protein